MTFYLLFFSSCCVAQLNLLTATALQLLPLRQQKVQSHASAGEKSAVLKKNGRMGERNTEQQEASGLGSSGKLQKHGAVCCVL